MNYRQCLDYLEQIQTLGIKFGLDNVRTILAAFDFPHHQFSSVVVAGSNGKGSVCAMLTKILTLQGYKAGLYTSPHLMRYEERIRIGDEFISPADFSLGLTRLKAKIEDLVAAKKLASHPTHFELLTCLALLYFRDQAVDIAVLEVGMGGRFDATNVVLPLVTAITTISFEHQRSLGNSLKEIAFEKAGIIKPGVPVICGAEDVEVLATIEKKADDCRAPVKRVFGPEHDFQSVQHERTYTFTYKSDSDHYQYTPSLLGRHQGKNAAITIVLAEELANVWKFINKNNIIRGIETTCWPGRLEVASQKPLVILDGAHNEEGARSFRSFVRDTIPPPIILVFAIMQDKKIEDLAEILFPMAEKVILTRFPYHRAATPEQIHTQAHKFHERLEIEPNPENAVIRALNLAGQTGTVLVAGSLFLVGEVKKHFEKER